MTNLQQIERHFEKGKGYTPLIRFFYKVKAIKIIPVDGLKLDEEEQYPLGYFQTKFKLFHPLIILFLILTILLGWIPALLIAGVSGVIDMYSSLFSTFFKISEKKSIF